MFLKVTRYLNTDDNLFAYYSYGNESFLIKTIDEVGSIDAQIFGVGGTYFIWPSFGLLPSFEYQDRDRGTRYVQFGLELKFRW